jgi:hypothetical protein
MAKAIDLDSIAAATAVFEAGGSFEEAAAAASVTARTVQRWATRGRVELEKPFTRLAVALDGPVNADSEPLTEDDLVALLETRARAGNVRAIQLLLARLDQVKREIPADDEFAEFDQLAERRRKEIGLS